MTLRKINFSCILITYLFLCNLYPETVSAQFYKKIIGNKQEDNRVKVLTEAQLLDISNKLKSDINYLSSDKLNERSTGSGGERIAGMFLQSRMEQELLLPYQSSFRHAFKYVSGKSITPEVRLKIDNKFVFVPEDAFPATFSATTELENFILPETTEPYTTWLVPLYQSAKEASDPNFDWEGNVYERSKNAIKRNAVAIIFYDQYGAKNPPAFSKIAKYEALSIPVIILQKKAYEQHIQSMSSIKPYYANIRFKNDYSEGNNVIGYINNNAAKTVVISASYDRAKQQSGRKKNVDMQNINDDASGVSAMLSLSKVLKASTFTQYNYIFAALSGSEQGFLGVQSFLKELGADTSKIAYAINFDNVASLNTSRKLYVSGGSTSALFKSAFKSVDSSFKINRENLNIIIADQNNYSEKGIPAVCFTTENPGHKMNNQLGIDYSGLRDIVNYVYNFIGELNFKHTPVFNASNEVQSGSTNGKIVGKPPVSLGIDLNYEYDKIGVLVKTVEPNSPAQKAGVLPDDVVFQIGTFRIDNEQNLNEVLTKFKKRDNTKIKIKRGVTVQTLNLMF